MLDTDKNIMQSENYLIDIDTTVNKLKNENKLTHELNQDEIGVKLSR